MNETWTVALSDFLLGLQGSKEEKTVLFYRTQLRQLQYWAMQEDVGLEDFRAKHMRQYLAWRADPVTTLVNGVEKTAPRVSDRTRLHDARCAKVFFRFCNREGYSEVDALKEYKVPKAAQAHVKAPAPEEIDKLLRAVTNRFDVRTNSRARFQSARDRHFWRTRDTAIICMLVETGLRIGEVFDLALTDYKPLPHPAPDGSQGCLTVRTSKGDDWRDVPITSALVGPMAIYLKARPTVKGMEHLFVSQFGERLRVEGWGRTFRRYLDFAGLERFTRHGIRHYTLTALVGVNPRTAQLVAGHKNISTTMGYDHTSKEKVAADHAKASPLGKILINESTERKKRKKIL